MASTTRDKPISGSFTEAAATLEKADDLINVTSGSTWLTLTSEFASEASAGSKAFLFCIIDVALLDDISLGGRASERSLNDSSVDLPFTTIVDALGSNSEFMTMLILLNRLLDAVRT